MICQNCQAEVDDLSYCPHCGSPLHSDGADASQPHPTDKHSAKRARRRRFSQRWLFPLAGLLTLIAFGILWGYLYGLITNIWFWTAFVHPLTMNTFIITQLNTIWFDTFHALGNAAFMGFLGTKTIIVLQRFRKRFSIAFSN